MPLHIQICFTYKCDANRFGFCSLVIPHSFRPVGILEYVNGGTKWCFSKVLQQVKTQQRVLVRRTVYTFNTNVVVYVLLISS